MRGALTATAVAEYFRDSGRDVLFMMDSLTRFALAGREVGLATGEPPATRGYPPSVFGLIPRLLERAGRTDIGSITGLYNVLVEGDDLAEPIADIARATLDGHIVLSRDLADRAHYPAIDVLGSVSRVMRQVVDAEHARLAKQLKQHLAAYKEMEDLINIGAYQRGTNSRVDAAIDRMDGIVSFLQQDLGEGSIYEEAVERLRSAVGETREFPPQQQKQAPPPPQPSRKAAVDPKFNRPPVLPPGAYDS
jgi:flagellum-specific ATP synthase